MSQETGPQPPDETPFLLPEISPQEAHGTGEPVSAAFGGTKPLIPTRDRIRETMQWATVAGAAYMILIGIAIAMRGGVAGDILTASFNVLPIALIGFLAYLGTKRQWAMVLACLWFGMMVLAVLSIPPAIAVTLAAIAATVKDQPGAPAHVVAFTTPFGIVQLMLLVIWSVLGLIAAIAPLIPSVRSWVAQQLPLDDQSPVNAFALSLVCCFTVVGLGQLIGTGGRPVLLTVIQARPELVKELMEQNLLAAMVYGLGWTILGVMLVVGFPVVRSAPEALVRLGLVRPTLRQVLGGLLLAGAMVGVVTALDPVITMVWKFFGWPMTDSKAFSQLLAPAMTPLGAVILGVTAGVGEELMIRGALQPRLGMVLPNLCFTGLHAFQYGFDGLLVVFLIGMVLAVVRARTNTTTAAVVHGSYDFILVMISVLTGKH